MTTDTACLTHHLLGTGPDKSCLACIETRQRLQAEADFKATSVDFISAVLGMICDFGKNGDLPEAVWWRVDEEYAPVTFFVNCNDLFYWACADCEKLTPDNLPLLERAIADVRAAQGVPLDFDEKRPVPPDLMAAHWDNWYRAGSLGVELFCARVRGMRPQQPCYKTWPPAVAALFDACGPVRDPKEEG